jgi:DMSO reductase family type II enzyme molybdopterin subunit
VVTTQAPRLTRLTLAGEELTPDESLERALATPYEYRSWEDIYRDQWSWDKVAKVTHTRVNCISACSLDAFVKDGIVLREEQNANYEPTCPDVPDFNPRGCPAGCIYSRTMYDPTRIKYPLKRAGPRGSGRWQRLSWDEALTEIADRILDVVTTDGPECIVYDNGTTNIDFGIGSPLEGMLFGNALGGTTLDSYAGVGDLPTGFIQTWGVYMLEGTSDDWFLSDYILIWIGNPSYARVTEAHFINEARYRGAKVVSIAPDYSASTIHADRWLNVRYGTDAALALGIAHVLIRDGLYKTEYVKEQTDLPLLVREDTGNFLRQSDLEKDGADGIFYFWDQATDALAQAPGTWVHPTPNIELGDLDPVLEGRFKVRLRNRRTVWVRPVFELLKERLRDYTPEKAASITGIGARNIELVAQEMAAAGSVMIYASWGACKHYHSDLFQRGMAYLLALTGNSGGKPGSGAKVSTWWPPPSGILTAGGGRALPAVDGSPPVRPPSRLATDPPPPGLPIDRIIMRELQKAAAQRGRGQGSPLIPWLYAHDPKFAEIASNQDYNDPHLKRPVADYMSEVFEKDWQPVWPRPPKRPRFFYFSGPNPLRRWPMPQVIRDSLWESMDTIVTTDFRMSTSGLWADYILPACGYYEKPGIKYTISYIPFVVVGERAVPPLYESLHEWDIVLMLAKKLQEQARVRGISEYLDAQGRMVQVGNIYDNLSANGAYSEGEKGEERALDYVLQYSAITRASGLGEGAWGKAAEKGMVRIKAIQPSALGLLFGSVYSDFKEDRPLFANEWFVVHKQPWPTLTGRQQFYIDHSWFMDADEQLVRHKEPLAAGGDYPLRLSGGHTRWSMHAIWRADAHLLRLQRGEPLAFMSVVDARDRGIEDNDEIRIFNDIGSFSLHAAVSQALPPGVVLLYHAWEGYQFPDWATQNDVSATPMKPLAMVGDYAHLHYRMAYYTMNHIPKEVAIEVERLDNRRSP